MAEKKCDKLVATSYKSFGERSSAGRASVCGCERHYSRPLFSVGYNAVIRSNSGYLVDSGRVWVRIGYVSAIQINEPRMANFVRTRRVA